MPERGFYYHYKHDLAGSFDNYAYEVLGIALHSETKEHLVLYRPLYDQDFLGPAMCSARPLGMFMEDVEKDGKTMPRFARITDTGLIAQLEAVRKKKYGE